MKAIKCTRVFWNGIRETYEVLWLNPLHIMSWEQRLKDGGLRTVVTLTGGTDEYPNTEELSITPVDFAKLFDEATANGEPHATT